MKRDDNTKFLLYIEPSKEEKSTEPVDDELTKVMEYALSKAKSGTANYSSKGESPNFNEGGGFKGSHSTDCGERSSNKDYLLENGMITTSLATFYVRWYRGSIPVNDMEKLNQLKSFYGDTDLTVKLKKEKPFRVKNYGGFRGNFR